MTWNCSVLTATRGLQLENLIKKHDVAVAVITETELDPTDEFSIDGYIMYKSPISFGKVRQVTLVKSGVKHKSLEVNQTEKIPSTWVHITDADIIVGGLYRQWHRNCRQNQWNQLDDVVTQATAAAMVCDVVLMGDINFDMARLDDPNYQYRDMLGFWLGALKEAGINWKPTAKTWVSYGKHADGHRESTLDHVYVSDNRVTDKNVTVLPDSVSDHFPL